MLLLLPVLPHRKRKLKHSSSSQGDGDEVDEGHAGRGPEGGGAALDADRAVEGPAPLEHVDGEKRQEHRRHYADLGRVGDKRRRRRGGGGGPE